MYDTLNPNRLDALGMLAPAAMKAFDDFETAALADGAVPVKYKHLMAVAVALSTPCTDCLKTHEQAARQAGATDQELAETTCVAAALRARAAVSHGVVLVGNSK